MHTLVNWHLGGAVYTLGHQFARIGTAMSLLGLGLAACMTLFIYHLLIDASIARGVHSFPELVSQALGRPAGKLLSLLVVINVIGVFSAYVKILQDIVPQLYIDNAMVDNTILATTIASVLFGALSSNAWDVPVFNYIANGALGVLILGLVWLQYTTIENPQVDVAKSCATSAHSNGHDSSLYNAMLQASTIFVFAFSSAEIVLDTPFSNSRAAATNIRLQEGPALIISGVCLRRSSRLGS